VSKGRAKRYRLPRILLIGLGLVVVLSFLAAIGASKLYWGYYTRPPSLDRRIRGIERVVCLTAVGPERRPDGSIGFVTNDAYRVTDGLSACRANVDRTFYDCFSERIIVALENLGKLPASLDRMSAEELAALYGHLDATGLLHDGSPGYDRAKELRGIVLEAEGKNGQHLLFVGVDGGQVSNDHYPYYEFLFHLPGQDSEPVLLSYNRLYYDVAGIEGLQWPSAWLIFFVLGTVTLVLVMMVLLVINASGQRSRSARDVA